MITTWIDRGVVDRLGWTLIHFIWQGAGIALFYGAARKLFPRPEAAQGRYLLACSALVVMMAAPILTYVRMNSPHASELHVSPVVIASAVRVPLPEQPFQTVPTAPAPTWRGDFMPGLVVAWFGGVIFLSLRLVVGVRSAVRLRSYAVRPAPREWQDRLDRLRDRLGITRVVSLCVSGTMKIPVVIGWLRPVVLIPAGALSGLPSEWIEAFLAHELAHVRRGDYAMNIMQKIAEGLLFYHPAVWWISREIREERELCCDDIALGVQSDRIEYARMLAGFAAGHPNQSSPVLALTGGSLRRRIARLLGQTSSEPRDPAGSGVLAGALLLASFGALGLWAQTAESRPHFDVASVKSNRSGTGVDHVQIGGGTVTIQNVSLKRLIGMAHGVPEGRNYLFSGPEWLDSENFDVLAKYSADTPGDQVLPMLQRELEERFSLRLHREKKEFTAYALLLVKDGPKFKPSTRQGGPYRFSVQNGHAVGSAITMGMLGDRLSRPDFGLDRPVVDQTGLSGSFDITFDWKPGEPDAPSASLFAALQEQLGLKLEARKIPLEVLVVDHAEKVPKEN